MRLPNSPDSGARYPGARIWAVWQPHTYSRTLGWLEQIGSSFSEADKVIVTGVYAARETPPAGFDLDQIADAIEKPQARALVKFADVSRHLLDEMTEGDVLIVFSAGDATQVSAAVLAGFQLKEMVS